MQIIKVKFFAAVREATGTGAIQLETNATRVGELRQELVDTNPAWQVLASEETLAAVNQDLCDNNQALAAGDEVAFFPFMTGG